MTSEPDSGLQRRYRRLIASYPVEFREQHGEELLVVMLDCARDGQRFPRPRDAANLVAHGFRARVRDRRRRTSGGTRDRTVSYGDSLSAASVHGLGFAPVGSWVVPSRLKWVAALIAVAAIVVPIVVAIPYVFFDHALAGYTGSGSAVGAVGQTSYYGVPVRPAGNTATSTTLNLRSVTPRIAVNTAHATVTVLVCTGFADRVGAFVYGGTTQDAAHDCTRLADFHSGTMRIGTSTDTQITTGVVLAVTPHGSGLVRIEGANVTYRQGIRYGDQRVGMDWSLRVP